MKTKELIVTTALSLFNKNGSYSVTTNHIAEEMRISPGNLYYHFNNKEEIIREIFNAICFEFAELWAGLDTAVSVENIFNKVLKQQAGLYFKYRFFYIELPMLMQRDEELHKDYIVNYNTKSKMLKAMFNQYRKQGILTCNDDEFEVLLQNCWIINDFWMSCLVAVGEKITSNSIHQLLNNNYFLFKPYIDINKQLRATKRRKEKNQ